MTPQDRLKDIESKNYEWSSEDVKWLIARVKKLEEAVELVTGNREYVVADRNGHWTIDPKIAALDILELGYVRLEK